MRLWSAPVAVALALAFGAASAQAAPFVYVTNGGSNDVSQYDVGVGGLLAPLSPAAVAAGDFPLGIAVSPDGGSVYVANMDSISQYDIGADGTLSPKTPSAVATGDLAPGVVAVSPDGKSVYVTASSGDPTYQTYVLQYDVDAGGALSPKSPAMVEAPEFFSAGGVAVSPDGKSVYVGGSLSVPGGHEHPGYVLQYDVGTGGALSPKNPPTVDAGEGAGELAVSPDDQSVYVVDLISNDVSQYDVGAGGALSPKNPPTVASACNAPQAVAVSPDGQSVYVSDFYDPTVIGRGDVSQYDVGAGGGLSPKSPATVLAGSRPHGVAVSPDGKSVYVTNASSDTVSQYDVGADGTLTPKSPPTVATGNAPFGIAVSPARAPTHPEQCKRGGWRDFPQFRNQGSCVSFVETHR
jgi:6-phosphogluconolactonase